jgi:hypothetical protein
MRNAQFSRTIALLSSVLARGFPAQNLAFEYEGGETKNNMIQQVLSTYLISLSAGIRKCNSVLPFKTCFTSAAVNIVPRLPSCALHCIAESCFFGNVLEKSLAVVINLQPWQH